MNKKKALLLCLLVLVMCLFGAVGCELAETEHTHDYVEHAATAATCTADGNELYYTCKGCDKIFDKDKNEISSVPVVKKIDHDYVEHAATAATCTANGNELYYTCKNCDKIFDKDKKEISSVPVIAASHAYVEHAAVAATCTADGNELYYTCDGCHGLFDKDKQPIAEIPVIAAKNHAYHEVPAVAAGCETTGNDLYYTCDNGCGKLFDKDKTEIAAVPVTRANGHTYVEHAAVAATCTADGNELYYTCANCDKIFDKDKKETTSVPTIGVTGHDFAWVRSDDGKTAELKCANDGCAESKGTINLAVNEDNRAVVDFDGTNATINLGLFGEGLTAKSVKYLQKTATVTTDGDNATFAVADLFDYAVGKVAVQLTVAKEDKEIEVEMLLTVAKMVNNIDDLLALRPTPSNGLASVTGGKVEEVDGHRVVTSYYYLLTTDLDGTTRTGKTVYGEDITDEGDTSGNAKSGFVGIFDGGKHTISNFEMPVRGFFGHVGCGTIANVTFANIVLSGEQSTVLGKLMNATLFDVTIENIEITATLNDVAGVVAYHEIFGSTLSDVNIDLGGLSDKVYVLARQLSDGTGEWKANLFERVTVKADYNKNVRLTRDEALTDTINGLTVQFTPFSIDKPVGNDETYYYTGHELTYAVAASELYTVSGNKQTEIGTYTVTVSLKPYVGLTWADGTTDDVTFTFAIIELTDEIAQQLAAAFAEKVEALGTPIYPRDNAKIAALIEEYDALAEKVQQKLVDVKAALDNYKIELDKYMLVFDTTEQNKSFVNTGEDYGDYWKGSVSTITDDVYGNAYLFSIESGRSGSVNEAEFKMKKNVALTDYDKLVFYVYNSTDTMARLFKYNDWQLMGSTELAPHAWTKIEVEVSAMVKGANLNKLFFLIQSTGESVAGEWKVTTFYAYKATAPQPGEEIVLLSVNGTVDNETHGKVLQGSLFSLGNNLQAWINGFGFVTLEQYETLKSNKDSDVHFYLYNPCDETVSVKFYIMDRVNWWPCYDEVTLAQGWNRISLNAIFTNENVNANGVQPTIAASDITALVQEGWMISDFYGTVK